MAKKSIEDIDVSGKRCLVRVDFNVPQDKQTGGITNPQRIVAALPTLEYLLEHGASLVLMSHLGRPNGMRVEKFTLRPVAAKLEELIGRPVRFVDDCVGSAAEEACASLRPGEIVLLENLRFHIEEEGKAKQEDGTKVEADADAIAAFREGLTSLGDIYVNDAFGTAHRAHSSVVGICLEDRVSGYLMRKELDAFDAVLENPKRPFLAILGGAKVADKIPLIRNLIDLADEIIVGGGMAFTFKKVIDGMPIGDSLYDEAGAAMVPELMKKAEESGTRIHLPTDFVCADKFDAGAEVREADDATGVPEGWMGLDCGPASSKAFAEVIGRAGTVVWNGPAGVFEFERFAAGTESMAMAMADATARGAMTVVGGGDTATAASKFGVAEKVSHCSTGGGASLELLEGKTLPGVAALSDK